MRCLMRNQRDFWYALYVSRTANTDDYGNETGEGTPVYGNPVSCEANISPASGSAAARPFGTLTDYDKMIVMDDPETPIDENAVLWIDREPQLNQNGTLATGQNGEILTPWDYTVKRVARSLNSVAIAVSKVIVR